METLARLPCPFPALHADLRHDHTRGLPVRLGCGLGGLEVGFGPGLRLRGHSDRGLAGGGETIRYGRMPVIVGNDEIAGMLGVSKQRAKQLMDARTHPRAPKGQRLSGGTYYLKADVEVYALEILGRPKTWLAATRRHSMPNDDSWGSRETYESGDRVVKIKGCRPGVVLREVKPGRFGKRYSVRDDISGTVGSYRVIDLRPLGLQTP